MTAALEGGEWLAARPDRTLPPGKTRYPFYWRLGGPQGRSGRAENLVPTGIRSRAVQPAVSRYTDWATRPTLLLHLVGYLYYYTFLILDGGQCMHLPSAIQTMNRTHVSAFRCTMSSTLQKMLSAGIKGTSGTLNRRPAEFCWWAVMTSKPETTGFCFSCCLHNFVAKFGGWGSTNLIKGRTVIYMFTLTLWRQNYFFLISAHPVYKMWIIQEPNKLALWNKLHFEEKKTESIEHV